MRKSYPLTLPIAIENPFKGLVSFKLIVALTLSSLLFLLVFSVVQANNYAKEVHSISQYENEVSRLAQENKDLEVQFAAVDSLDNIDNYLEVQNFSKIRQAEYARLMESTAMAR